MKIIEQIRQNSNGVLDGVSDGVIFAMVIIVALVFILTVVSIIVSIMLSVKYSIYNRRANCVGKTGAEIARNILDNNGINHIKVTKSGSMLFGNSYSHYFKKVRLRRRTWQKSSVTSLAMAAQKSALAVLDKEKDSDMKRRVRLTPIRCFGPLAFVPLIIVGVILDVLIYKVAIGKFTIALAIAGIVFYALSFVLTLMVLKTEIKAQKRAIQIMKEENLGTAEEIEMSKKLFRLYNIEYVNDTIMALLELIYRVLQFVAALQNNSEKNKS